ncbi:SEC-C motif domain protein [Glaciecola nitratireducens FR1064]|uniref:SEC-C motif domain protein n=1 Tax=Glaciecola nitratireducens (strain JCM 12485 / KCTC 12276 / FR1064) TaxID=1085623 RepID=G4QH56_GLANF|nr:SEC-C motif domain protein [Glaciecola nitratireducens FR1064]
MLDTTESDDVGTVEFVATYSIDGDFFAMHELSSFIKQDGNWYYTSGLTKEKSGQITPTRNDPCPCGSGKKYKKCCLA